MSSENKECEPYIVQVDGNLSLNDSIDMHDEPHLHDDQHHDLIASCLQPSYYPCYICEEYFENYNEFCEHCLSSHPCHFFPCYECEIAFASLYDLEDHIANQHQDIPQVDGTDLDLTDFNFTPCNDNTRTKNYALNEQKQMNEIRKDAKIDDFTITVNNSDENCTIKCSSGFYIQVAKSSFTTLDTTTLFTVQNVAISVSNVTISRDLHGSEANRIIHFNFAAQNDTLGGVTVHLHHSTRTIQVQGSKTMPNGTKAALWFVNHVITGRFKEQATAKKYAIKNFNDAVQKQPTQNIQHPSFASNACYSCNLIFNKNSKPSFCNFCSKYLHKSCLKEHTKICKAATSTPASQSTSLATQPPPSILPQQSSLPTVTISGSRTLVSFVPSRTTVAPHSSSLQLVSSSGSSTASRPPPPCSQSSATPQPSASLSQPTPPPAFPEQRSPGTIIPTNSSIVTSSTTSTVPIASYSLPALVSHQPVQQQPNMVPPQQPATTRPTKRKTKTTIPNSQDITVEFLERELVSAQARISQLDTTIKDKELQISVLLARVKHLEERENKKTYEKYFSDDTLQNTHHETPADPPNLGCSLRCWSCSHIPPPVHCQQLSHHCPGRPSPACSAGPPSQSSHLEQQLLKMNTDLNEVKQNIQELRCEFKKLLNKKGNHAKNQDEDLIELDCVQTIAVADITTNEPPDPIDNSILDSSISTIEELIPENPLLEPDLNC